MILESIFSQNFMSIGDDGLELKLNAHPVTVVVGSNGSGKSVFLIDTLYFNFFGKPFRDDFSIGDLVNDETKKNMLTVSKFENNGNKWEVKRGRKNKIEFEIYKDGVLIPVPAKLPDYQKYLEETVLGFDAETFKQVVILGSSAYVPFMKLKKPERRKVVEDLLSIRIFSVMNDVAKEDAKQLRADIDDTSHKLALANQAVRLNEQKIQSLKEQSKTNVSANKTTIEDNNKRIVILQDKIKAINLEIETLNATITDSTENKRLYSECGSSIENNERIKRRAITNAQFYKDNCTCPECKQNIDDEFKKIKFKEFKLDHQNARDVIIAKSKQQEIIKVRLLEIRDVILKAQEKQKIASGYSSEISSLQGTNQHLFNEIQRQSNGSEEQMIQAKDDLKIAKDKQTKNQDALDKFNINMIHVKAELELLKDGNIKGDVIRQYMPVINKYVQKNLDILEFPMSFKMDENFKETLVLNGKTRSYSQLSEGEKMRVDLSILFAWRSVAKDKASADSSLIVFDEIASSCMDNMDLMKKLVDYHNKNSNVFNITHDLRVAGEYDNVIKVSLKGKFTEIETLEN